MFCLTSTRRYISSLGPVNTGIPPVRRMESSVMCALESILATFMHVTTSSKSTITGASLPFFTLYFRNEYLLKCAKSSANVFSFQLQRCGAW